jgi:urease accessory protein
MSNRGRAQLTCTLQSGRTCIRHQFSQAPLQWLGPIDRGARVPVYYLRNPNGGLLHGDEHQLQITMEADTALEIRTQGATRIHPGTSGQTIQLQLAEGSTLIWIAHPLIPGAGSQFSQQIAVQIHPSARLAYADIWTAGRLAMGEIWQFQRLQSQFKSESFDPPAHLQPLVWECVDLEYPHTAIQSRGGLGSYTCWGTLYLLGDWQDLAWENSLTQWSLNLDTSGCRAQILRQVGHQSASIWESFRTLISSKSLIYSL